LDPAELRVRLSVRAGRLVPTDEDATGDLQKMPPHSFSADRKRAARELPVDDANTAKDENPAAALVALKLPALIAALPDTAPDIIMEAGELEGAKDSPRKGALEAMATALANG